MSRIIRIHCVKPIAFIQIEYGLHTWTSGPCALVCIYSKGDERVIKIPGANIAPGNHDALDQFGNKPCYHLKTDGDLYCLPDSFQVVDGAINGWHQLGVKGHGSFSGGFTQLEFCSLGGTISLEQNDCSIEFSPVFDYDIGQSIFCRWAGSLRHTGSYTGHCTGYVNHWGTSILDCYTDYNGLKYPYSLYGYTPRVAFSSFDIRRWLPNFNGYTFSDVLADVFITLRDLVTEAVVMERTKEYWQQQLSNCLVDALNGLRLLSIDSIAYIRDTFDLSRALSVFREIKRRPLSKKTWADVFLTYRYGLRLFANDTLSIAKAINKESSRDAEPFQTARSTHKQSVYVPFGNPIEQEMHVKVYADNHSLADMSLIAAARSIDLYPSFSNIWDLIPYSFVVDWFLPAGEILGKLDAYSDVQDLHTRSCVASVKSTKLDHISGAFGYSGDIKTVCYQREVLTPNDMSRALSSGSVHFLDGVSPLHLFDGLALRFQRH